MKPGVQMYFMDIKDVCKNVMKEVQQVQQVSEELSKTPQAAIKPTNTIPS